jgi:hypothetical protein
MGDIKNPFEGLSKKNVVLGDLKDPAGNPLIVRPAVKDAEIFMSLKRDDPNEQRKITGIFVDMIKRTWAGSADEDIEIYVAMNYGKLLEEITILYGFTTREDLESTKAKNREATEKKLAGR